MLQQKKLNEITPKEEITLFLLINKIEIKTAKTGNDFINLELKDQSGTIQAKIWEKIEDYSKMLFDGAVVKINGIVEEFNNTLQLNIKKIRLATPDDGITTEDFLPKSSRNFDEMKKEFFDAIDSIKNPFIKKLLENIFNGDILNNYFRTPAGKNWHHSYLHGLLEHTIEIVKICDLVSSFHKEIKRDVLIAGALLHDIGKIEELTYSSNFDYTDQGKLLGHIMIGATLVEKHISLIPDFPCCLTVSNFCSISARRFCKLGIVLYLISATLL